MATNHRTKSGSQIAKRADLLLADKVADGPDDTPLTTAEVAAWFRCSTQFLEILRTKNLGPRFDTLGPRMVRYTRGNCKKWLKSMEVASTADYPRKTKSGARAR